MKTLKTFWFILLLSLFFSTGLYAQNEANVWYFNDYCGLDFNTGTPVVLFDGQTHDGWAVTTISDSLGNFLLSSDWANIYTKNGMIDNGTDLVRADESGAILIKWPGKDSLYYLFTSANPNFLYTGTGFYYSVIDLQANNGLGSVTEKNIEVEDCWDVNGKVAAVKRSNSENVWVFKP